MALLNYNRAAAVAYAKKWAFGRNPAFYDYSRIGGDCTNFASQCIFAGAGVMNFTPTFGWYYRTANEKAPAWAGVEYLYNFLVSNEGNGPFGEEAPLNTLEVGDIVQLGTVAGDFYHTPVIVGFNRGEILLAAHTYDAFNKPLSSYNYGIVRGIRILGVRA